MATIRIFSAGGIKELNCFDTADDVEYLSLEQDEPIQDDGELTVGLPISE